MFPPEMCQLHFHSGNDFTSFVTRSNYYFAYISINAIRFGCEQYRVLPLHMSISSFIQIDPVAMAHSLSNLIVSLVGLHLATVRSHCSGRNDGR